MYELRSAASALLLASFLPSMACSDRVHRVTVGPVEHGPRILGELQKVRELGPIAIEAIAVSSDGRVDTPVTGMPAHRTLRAVLPAATLDTRLEVGSDDFWLKIRPLDVEGGTPERVKNAIVRTGIARATDAAFVARPEEVEELRILRSGESRVLRWSLHVGAGVATVREREGRIELLDASGYARLQSAPPFAIDARGRRFELSPRLVRHDGQLVVELPVSLPDDVALPVVVDPLWTTRAPMKTARSQHGAVVLSSGQLLVMGGTNASAVSAAEIYDPATNTWTATTSMNRARAVTFAMMLSSGAKAGKVFVVGGDDQKSAEIFDPVAKSWTLTGSMNLARGNPAVIEVGGGNVLAVGGDFDASEHRAELWTASTGTWAYIGAAGTGPGQTGGRRGALLPGGNVVVGGGFLFGLTTGSTYVYRPATNDFVSAAGLPTSPSNFTMTALSTGGVLAAGGYSKTSYMGAASYPTQLEIYNGATDSWSNGPTLGASRQNLSTVVLSNNRVLFTGGDGGGAPIATAELFDPVANTVVPITSMAAARESHTSTLMPDGTVVVAGGVVSGTYLSSVELFAQGAVGAACSAVGGWECKSGFCVDGTCCSTSSCAAGLHCDAPSKKGTCTKYKGSPCTIGSECENGFCADGVCCDAACNGTCEACNLPAKAGTCSAVVGVPATGHGTCSAGTTTCNKQSCNGTDRTACHYASTATACSAKACTAGIETHTSTCDGSGACKDVPVSCGAYVCNAATSTCFTSCTSSSACAAGQYCKGTTCVPLEGLGTKCDAVTTCGAMLTCVDGVCCGTSSCSPGSSCALPGHLGTCSKQPGTSCTADAECGSGFCTDGRCCNTACNGQCEACNVDGALGVCTPVTGAAHGTRPACTSDPSNPCSASSCDGADRTTCAKHAGSDVSCRDASCVDGMVTAPAVCDGSGACPAAMTSSCGGYACQSDGQKCRTNCTDDAHCTTGFKCLHGKCAKPSATCSQDGLSLVANDGTSTSCSPYKCKDSACQTSCTVTDDCQSPTVCDTASSTCLAATTPDSGDQSSGGCSTTRHESHAGRTGWLALLGLALCFRRRNVR